MGTPPLGKSLKKRDVELLMDNYDTAPVESLLIALSVLEGRPLTDWEDAVGTLALAPAERAALAARDVRALDALVKRLVEFRSLEQ